MKKLFLLLVCFSFFIINPEVSFAREDSFPVSNNRFGIHIMNEHDLVEAADLVNSSGGDWGYVTFVITEKERDHDRWQKFFDQARKLHLIPIVRLATKATGDTWEIPEESEIENWVNFLNSLNWVVRNRYVIINNEPNHAGEWGGKLDPAGYATYLKKISGELKNASSDFFILPAGLDPASTNTKTTMTEDRFLIHMMQAEPDIFDYIDGWTSHAYPNARIDIYKHELSLIGKDFPVFITETGWPNNKYSESQISSNLVRAFTNTWSDPKIVAVTPFILNYTSSPYNIYSWKKEDGGFYDFYYEIRKMGKVRGEPVQKESGQVLGAMAQPIIFGRSDFMGIILTKNTGESIWDTGNIKIVSDNGKIEFKESLFFEIEPLKNGLIVFKASLNQDRGVFINSIYLANKKTNKRITNSFPIEGVVLSAGESKMRDFMAKVVNSVRSLFLN